MIKISIITPVFNEAKILEKSLENLGTDGDIEVIVVDGGEYRYNGETSPKESC